MKQKLELLAGHNPVAYLPDVQQLVLNLQQAMHSITLL